MPGRKTPLINNGVYHIFNRGVASQPTFFNQKDYQRALESIFYYQNTNPPIKYSRFLSWPLAERKKLLQELSEEKNFLVEIISYCLMPNHFHLLLRQLKDNGISKFVSNFTNSYTRFFNTKRDREGPLFTGKFKSVTIENQDQLLHTSRYIHLNPYTSSIVKTLKGLREYPYSSLAEFTDDTNLSFCDKNMILSEFKNKASYKQFVFDQADYQRSLHKIKDLIID